MKSEKKHIVYGVSIGQYSDAFVAGIFSTKAKAFETAKKHLEIHKNDNWHISSHVCVKEKQMLHESIQIKLGNNTEYCDDNIYFYCSLCGNYWWTEYSIEEYAFDGEEIEI
jgi:hypothetical protein